MCKSSGTREQRGEVPASVDVDVVERRPPEDKDRVDRESLLHGERSALGAKVLTLCSAKVSLLAAGSMTLNGVLLGVLLVLLTKQPVAVSAPLDATSALDECHGHGIRFADAEGCTCFDCWTGATCYEPLPLDAAECVVQAGSGTPFLFEEYWVAHPEAAIEITPFNHVGYGADVPRLERAIRAVHRLVGNAEVDGRHIVIGVGSTEMINAALFALSQSPPADGAAPPEATIWAERPYYSGYILPSTFFESRSFHWRGNATPPTPTAAAPVIELVTSPNNPDGALRSPRLAEYDHATAIMDHAYLWPHFTATPETPISYGSERVALFTLSKATGHAATRIGWAITPDADLAARLQQFVGLIGGSLPRESALRASVILEHVTASRGEVFGFARERLLSRWERLQALFEQQAAFRLQRLEPLALDAFTGEEAYPPSPAYAWIERLDGGDALASMAGVGIAARSGLGYGASAAYVRLELLMREPDFVTLLAKLQRLLLPA